MISVSEAKAHISNVAKLYKRRKESTSLLCCTNKILAETVKSKYPSPPFNQSAMDGYAVNTLFTKDETTLKLINSEIKAGDFKTIKLKLGEAIRIFTGGAVPVGTNAVIPQESVGLNEQTKTISFSANKFKPSDHLRLKGEQFKKGEIILLKGDKLSPARIAIAATGGLGALQTYCKPLVTIISSGNELCTPGNKLIGAQVFESNSYMLSSLLNAIGIEQVTIVHLLDNEKKTIAGFEKAIKNSDVVIISGGISVGKYDFVKSSLDKLKTKTIFYKVNQKPGKPLYFGKNGNCFLFGLPGNPAASLTCFYEYVKPFLSEISGTTNTSSGIRLEKLKNNFAKKKGMTYFLKGYINENGVEILPDQESFKLKSFNKANCIVVGMEDCEELKAGDFVECHPIEL